MRVRLPAPGRRRDPIGARRRGRALPAEYRHQRARIVHPLSRRVSLPWCFTMSFEWLRMRIQEEQDRRQRESEMLDRLPRAMEELHGVLKQCTAAYAQSFGDESVDIQLFRGRIKVTVREFEVDKWQTTGKVEVVT